MSGPLLQVVHETIGTAVVVHVAGEIDLLTAPELQVQLEKACERATQPEIVVADLTDVRFLGSAGLSALLAADKHCRAKRMLLRIVVTTPGTVRPLQVTGLDRVLDVVGSLAAGIRSA